MVKYKPNSKGLAEIARSSKAGSLSMAAANRIAAKANALDPRGRYQAESARVPVGTRNELRAGARVVQTQRSPARNQALKKAVK